MNIDLVKELFGWMTLVNLGFYMWTAIMCVVCKGFVTRVAVNMFGVSEEAGKAVIYGYVGMYKLLFITFNLVPWLALTIMVK